MRFAGMHVPLRRVSEKGSADLQVSTLDADVEVGATSPACATLRS